MGKKCLDRIVSSFALALVLFVVVLAAGARSASAQGDEPSADPFDVLPTWWSAPEEGWAPVVLNPVAFDRQASPVAQPFALTGGDRAVSSAVSQAGLVYTSTPGLTILSDACVSDVITVTSPTASYIADLNVGLNVDFALLRGALTATLRGPSGTAVKLLASNPAGYHANYDLWLDDASRGAIEDYDDDDTAPPYYDRDAAPVERLATFNGQEAQGAWTLEMCSSGAPFGGRLNFWSLELALRDPMPIYAAPHSYKGAPYKVEAGAGGAYVIVVTNTGELEGAATFINDTLPAGTVQHAPATYAALGGGVATSGFGATDPITWLGSIPAGQGVRITVPVTVTASAGAYLTNTVVVTDPDASTAAVLAAGSEVYPAGALGVYRPFDVDESGMVADGPWRWGMPASGPLTCHSQPYCWGANGNSLHILSGTLDLPAILSTQALWLQWWEWLDVAEELSVVTVLMESSSNPSPEPIHGVLGVGLTPDLRTNQGMWREVLYDVTPHASETITLYFYYVSLLPSAGSGWYVDDLGVHVAPATPRFDGAYKAVRPGKVTPGDALTYTIFITNVGQLTSTAGRMFDALPAGLAVTNVNQEGGGTVASGSDWVEWTTAPGAPLAPGEGVALTVAAAVGTDVACGTSLVNTALVTDSAAPDDVRLTAAPVSVYPALHGYWDLELDAGALISNTDGDWEWGAPDAVRLPGGPTMAHSGRNVWGTDLDDEMNDDIHVLTKTVDLSGFDPDTGVVLQWWEWLSVDDEWQQAVVEIASATDPEPQVVYGQRQDGLTDEQRAHERTWNHVVVDITPWAGQPVTITFSTFPSFLALPLYPGWYLDDVSIHADCPHVFIGPDQTAQACPGDVSTFVLSVRNTTASADTLDIVAGGGGWPAQVSPATLSLGPGEEGTVTVTVDVLLSAYPSEVQTTVVTATGQSSGWVDVATLQVTAGAGWEAVAPAPEAIIYHDLVAYGGETFLLGGVGESGTAITPSRKYSPTADAWYDLAPEPAPEIARPLDACLSENGDGDPVIVLFPTDDTVPDVHIYEIQSDAWYTAPYTSPLPAGGIAGAALVSDIEHNVCYLSGGQDSSGVTHTLYAYDVVSNTAVSLPAMTTPRVFHAAWLYEGMVCVGGGGSDFPPVTGLDSTQCYSITGGTWLPENDTLGPLPYPAWAMADAQGEREGVPQLWMMGGVRTFGPGMIEAEPRTAYWDADAESWMLGVSLLKPFYLGAGDMQGDAVYVVGGSESGAGFLPVAFHQRLIQCLVPKRVYLPIILRDV